MREQRPEFVVKLVKVCAEAVILAELEVKLAILTKDKGSITFYRDVIAAANRLIRTL